MVERVGATVVCALVLLCVGEFVAAQKRAGNGALAADFAMERFLVVVLVGVLVNFQVVFPSKRLATAFDLAHKRTVVGVCPLVLS